MPVNPDQCLGTVHNFHRKMLRDIKTSYFSCFVPNGSNMYMQASYVGHCMYTSKSQHFVKTVRIILH